jgi:hypothetical protein
MYKIHMSRDDNVTLPPVSGGYWEEQRTVRPVMNSMYPWPFDVDSTLHHSDSGQWPPEYLRLPEMDPLTNQLVDRWYLVTPLQIDSRPHQTDDVMDWELVEYRHIEDVINELRGMLRDGTTFPGIQDTLKSFQNKRKNVLFEMKQRRGSSQNHYDERDPRTEKDVEMNKNEWF